MKRTIRNIIILFICYISIFNISIIAHAESLPYTNYTYDKNGEVLAAPAAYVPSFYIDCDMLGIAPLKDPSDLCYSNNGALYILDTGNNRIVALDKDFKLIKAVDKFEWNGKTITLNIPKGMAIDTDNMIYVTDSANGRIVKMNENFIVQQIYKKPNSDLFPADFQYVPQKIAVDKAKRIFVISTGVNRGLMEFNPDGVFVDFIGAPKVTFNFLDYLWKQFSTKEQKDRQIKFVPTEFSNVVANKEGFLYATISTIDVNLQYAAFMGNSKTSQNPVMKLNSSGSDILVRNGVTSPYGDLIYTNNSGTIKGASAMVDITVDDNGIYSLLDSTRGRIFTYDSDGNLMYIFGGLGNQLGTFSNPVAIEKNNVSGKIIILDKQKGRITVFSQTEYGKRIQKAIGLYNSGLYKDSVQKWNEVLKYNSNYKTAYIGIGKNYFRNGDYANAVHYLKLADETRYQSKAFSYYRNQVLYNNIYLILITITAFVLLYILLFLRKRKAKKAGIIKEKYPKGVIGDLKYSLYLIFHPFKGFWEIKHERDTKLKSGIFLIALLAISFIVNSLYRGGFFAPIKPEEYNVFNDIYKVFIPIALWCIANWCLTSLMNGEGSFKDIYLSTTYAVVPMIVIYIPLTILSNFMVLDEASYYAFFMSVATIWTVLLILIGTMETHQYSAKKTIIISVFTVVGIGIIIFIGLVMYSVIQQIVAFSISIYSEINLRI